MNEITRLPQRPTTHTADGWPRIAWTHEDLDRMVEAGPLREEDRVEVVDGEIMPRSLKGVRHEHIRHLLADRLYRMLPKHLILLVEPGWRPAKSSYVEPDLLVVPKAGRVIETPGAGALLAIEIAATSPRLDTSLKRHLYPRLSLPEYWVISASTLATRVYARPADGGYLDGRTVASDQTLVPSLVPEIAVRLADLGIE
jgi:Uma2 family endonuclease